MRSAAPPTSSLSASVCRLRLAVSVPYPKTKARSHSWSGTAALSAFCESPLMTSSALCESPMTLSAVDARPMVASAAAASIDIPASHRCRFASGNRPSSVSVQGRGPGSPFPSVSLRPFVEPPRKPAVSKTSAPVCNNREGGVQHRLSMSVPTSPSWRESRKRIGTSHKSPSSRPERAREPYPDGLPDDSTRT